MKKTAKRLHLNTQTIRVLQADDLQHANGGSLSAGSVRMTPSVIAPTISQSGTSVISGGH